MKTIITILFSIMLTNSCSQSNTFENIKVKYEAFSRGYFFNITIENNIFLVQKDRNEEVKEIKILDSDWQKLAKLYSKIDFEKFNDLEGATKERHYDGKPHANLVIVKEGVEYTTKGFDHTVPPIEIKEFVDLIIKLASK